MMQRFLPVLLIPLLFTVAGFTVTHQGAIFVSGSTDTTGSIWVQIRDSAGSMDCQTTAECILASGLDSTAVRNCIAEKWDRDPPACYPICMPCANNIDCATQGVNVIVIYTDAAFTCWASSDSSSWTQIDSGSSFTHAGITLSATDHAPIPTFSEWGLILLAVLMVAAGVLAIRRQRLGVIS